MDSCVTKEVTRTEREKTSRFFITTMDRYTGKEVTRTGKKKVSGLTIEGMELLTARGQEYSKTERRLAIK